MDELARVATFPKHIRDLSFVQALRNASLDDGIGLTGDALDRLRNPPHESLEPDPDTKLALSMFFALEHSSEESYERIRRSIHDRHPDTLLPSFYHVKQMLADFSGVTSLVNDMCINSCAAFVGPYAHLDRCPECNEARYDQTRLENSGGSIKAPRAVFNTIPVAPQLQALWRHPESAHKMRYREQRTQAIFAELQANDGFVKAYDDVFCGSAYLDAVRDQKILPTDMLLMLSIDGVQIYEKKESDCWIYIWIILDLSPEHRYKKKHVFPGAIIPGLKKPKFIESFLFPGFHHLSAVQREGLRIWDASRSREFVSRLLFFLGCADGPGLTSLSNFVGHSGKHGCRMLCPLTGRRKPGGSQYYPVLLKPNDYDIPGCDHDDINPYDIRSISSAEYAQHLRYVLESRTRAEFESRRLQTGIVGPSIILGLQPGLILGIPECFSSKMMHLSGANMASLWHDIFRGSIECSPQSDNRHTWHWAVLKDGNTWKTHGQLVADCKPYLPGSFDVAPRDPSLHATSWYKSTEWIGWLYGVAPALLYRILPDDIWRNYCKFVAALRIMSQYSITPQQLQRAHQLFAQWENEFELIFYQRRVDRIHFVRPCVHLINHLASEAARVGSPICSSQWTMERTIGNLEQEIRQPSNPFANLAQQGIRRCQMNALKAMLPELDPQSSSIPRGATDLRNGYVLLPKRDRYPTKVTTEEQRVITAYLGHPVVLKLRRWARLRLPNGQVARSQFTELVKAPENVRMARNVKVFFFTVLIHFS